jgi:hypothetical protein
MLGKATMGVQFDFDAANKILVTRLEGELTDERARETVGVPAMT